MEDLTYVWMFVHYALGLLCFIRQTLFILQGLDSTTCIPGNHLETSCFPNLRGVRWVGIG